MKILAFFLISSFSIVWAACPPCSCSESISTSKNIEYNDKIKENKKKVEEKIKLINDKALKVKELQTQVNEKLLKLQNLKVHEYKLQENKNFIVTHILKNMSIESDLLALNNSIAIEKYKTNIKIMLNNFSYDTNNDLTLLFNK